QWHLRYPSSRRLESESGLIENFAKESNASQGQAEGVHVLNELHAWKGARVRVHLKAVDVTHSFFAPTYRLRQDVSPGKDVETGFEANESNVRWSESAGWRPDEEWDFVCIEHAKAMRGQILIHESKVDFLRWLKQAEKAPSKE